MQQHFELSTTRDIIWAPLAHLNLYPCTRTTQPVLQQGTNKGLIRIHTGHRNSIRSIQMLPRFRQVITYHMRKRLHFTLCTSREFEKQQEIHHDLMDAIKLMNKISYKPRNTKILLHKMPLVEIEDASTMYMKYGMYLHVHVPFSFSRLDQRLTYTLHNHKIVQEWD